MKTALSILALLVIVLSGCVHKKLKLTDQPPPVNTSAIGSNLRDVNTGVNQAKNSFDRIDNKAVILLRNWGTTQ